MRYSYELPVVQVARMSSLNDVEWLWKTLNEKILFDRIATIHIKGEYVHPVEELSFEDNGIIKQGFYFSVVGDGKHYVVWNQGKKAYLMKSHDGFTEDMVPEPLKKLVYVKDEK